MSLFTTSQGISTLAGTPALPLGLLALAEIILEAQAVLSATLRLVGLLASTTLGETQSLKGCCSPKLTPLLVGRLQSPNSRGCIDPLLK